MNERKERLMTPEARREIRSRKHIYYWRVRRCRALGYKRRPNAGRGVWWARIRLWDGKERQKALGTADDDAASDGITIFDFHQALRMAEEWFDTNNKDAAPDRREYEYPELFTHIPPPPPYTVGNAAKDYIEWFRVHRRGIYRAYSLVKNQIVAPLGHIPLSDLDPPRIQKWFDSLIEKPPVLATGRLCGPKFAELRTDPESIRKRKNTANTVLAQLKAILNRAFEHGYIDSNWAWVCVRPFKNVRHVAKPGYLERGQIIKLIDAARPDAARVIKGGLITGCRIGDLLKMQVEDYLQAKNRIIVFALKTQNLHHIALSEEGVEFFNEITTDRPRNEPMFITDSSQRWTRYRFRVQFLKAQEKAGVIPTITFHTLRHTYASYAAMAGLPLKAIANQLGHRSVRMVDLFYAHLSEDYLDEAIRERMPRLFTE